MAEIAQTGMTMHDLYPLTNEDLAKDGEGREDGGEGRLAVHDPVRDVVDFDAVGEVSDSCAAGVVGAAVGVGDDYYFVAAVDEFLLALVRIRCETVSIIWNECLCWRWSSGDGQIV